MNDGWEGFPNILSLDYQRTKTLNIWTTLWDILQFILPFTITTSLKRNSKFKIQQPNTLVYKNYLLKDEFFTALNLLIVPQQRVHIQDIEARKAAGDVPSGNNLLFSIGLWHMEKKKKSLLLGGFLYTFFSLLYYITALTLVLSSCRNRMVGFFGFIIHLLQG